MSITPIRLSLEDMMNLEDQFSVTIGAPTGVLASSPKKVARRRMTRRAAAFRRSRSLVGSKSKIVAHLAHKCGTPKKTTETFFNELFKLAVKECKGGGKFVIPNIGRIMKAHPEAHVARNPRTGERIKIKGKTAVRLRPAKAFEDAILK